MPPTTSTRGTPAGIKLDDGFSTKIAFALNLTVSFWEKTVKIPGIDGGDAIETTTMHNVTWRTMSPRQLKTLTQATGKAAFDPNIYNDILSLINREGSITIRFPDGSTLDFFGYLKSVEFDDLEEGKQPELSYVIVPTNQDPTTGAEAAPVLTSVAGT